MKRHERKRVVVVGLGRFGHQLAVEMAKYCDVLAIDRNHALVTAIGEKVQHALALDARDYATLSGVIKDAFDEAVVAFSGHMESNILCALHFRKLRLKRILAKAANDDHAEILHAMGIDEVVFPERETATRLAMRLANPNLLDFIPLPDECFVMEVVPPETFLGRSLAELNLRKRYGILVIAVSESVPGRTVPLPGPDFVVKPSDALLVIGTKKSLTSLREVLYPSDPAL